MDLVPDLVHMKSRSDDVPGGSRVARPYESEASPTDNANSFRCLKDLENLFVASMEKAGSSDEGMNGVQGAAAEGTETCCTASMQDLTCTETVT